VLRRRSAPTGEARASSPPVGEGSWKFTCVD
jgi:hypothetical protein